MNPNFVQLTSDRFNGGAADTAELHAVSEFIRELYVEWSRKHLSDITAIIATMEEKNFYEDAIIDEIKKRIKRKQNHLDDVAHWIKKRSSNP